MSTGWAAAAAAAAATAASGGGFADSVVNSALRFRAQAPLVDQLLREIGVEVAATSASACARPARPRHERRAAARPRRRRRRQATGAAAVIKVYVSSVIDAPRRRGVGAHPRLQRPAAVARRSSPTRASRAASRPTGSAASATSASSDGGVIREQLLALSDYDYQCTYSILESPMGVDNYVATLKLTPVTDGDRTLRRVVGRVRLRRPSARRAAQSIGQGVFQARLRRAEARDCWHETRDGACSSMIRVTRSAVIDAPIERVWAVLRDFNSHDRLAPGRRPSPRSRAASASDQVGCVRSFTLKDGNRIREQLLALSDRDTSRPTASSTPRCRCSATSPPSRSSA